MIKKVKTLEFWKNVRENSAYTKMVDVIKETYQKSKTDIIAELTFSERSSFHEMGERTPFETPYFNRRRYLASAAILALIYPEEEHEVQSIPVDLFYFFYIQRESCRWHF